MNFGRLMNRLRELPRYPTFVRLAWWRTAVPMRVRRSGVLLGEDVEFFGMPVISTMERGSIEIGHDCSLCSVSEYTALGVNHPIVLRTLSAGARIRIGPHTGISGATICAEKSVRIGSHVLVGANATIVDTDFHAVHSGARRYQSDGAVIGAKEITIHDNVFVGAGAFVLKGVTIGANSVVGACAVVTSSVPENTIVAGNPARVVGRVKIGGAGDATDVEQTRGSDPLDVSLARSPMPG